MLTSLYTGTVGLLHLLHRQGACGAEYHDHQLSEVVSMHSRSATGVLMKTVGAGLCLQARTVRKFGQITIGIVSKC